MVILFKTLLLESWLAEPQLGAQRRAKAGGADRIRTCDLLIANETLYQLSYDPIHHA